MIVAEISVTGAKAAAVKKGIITAGMVGAQIHIDYAPEWDSLRKTVVFSGVETRDVITDDPDVTIPPEVIAKPIPYFRVGVYGVDSGNNVVIPTLWADLRTVWNAADPSGDTSTDPSLPVWAQIQRMIGDPDKLTTQAKENLVAAINEAARSGGGTAADMVLEVADGYIRYSTDGMNTWKNLIAVSDLVGPKGDPGDSGEDGADATVTAESIRAALGYPPADAKAVSDLAVDVAKVPEFSGLPAVGQIFQVSAVGEDGKVTMEPANFLSDYILVASTITTEETSRWNVISSADGGPFKFNNLIVCVCIPSAMPSTTFEVDFDDSYGYEITLGYSGGYQKSIIKIGTFPDDFILFDFTSYDYSGKKGVIQLKKGRKIENRFRIASFTGSLPAGTELYLWGRRSEWQE